MIFIQILKYFVCLFGNIQTCFTTAGAMCISLSLCLEGYLEGLIATTPQFPKEMPCYPMQPCAKQSQGHLGGLRRGVRIGPTSMQP